MVLAVREFDDAEELLQHYREVSARVGSLRGRGSAKEQDLIQKLREPGPRLLWPSFDPKKLTEPAVPEEPDPKEKQLEQLAKFNARSRKAKILKIAGEVAAEVGVAVKVIMSRSRKDKAVFARTIVMYRARTELKYSYPEIGHAMDRDHSSVHHAVKKVERGEIAWNPKPD